MDDLRDTMHRHLLRIGRLNTDLSKTIHAAKAADSLFNLAKIHGTETNKKTAQNYAQELWGETYTLQSKIDEELQSAATALNDSNQSG